MPKFDVTQMRAHLKEYIGEISDLLTTEEDLSQFADFCAGLSTIDEITDQAYRPDADGNYPTLTEQNVELIKDTYQRTIDQANALLNKPFPGPAGQRMRGIVRELAPMLAADHAALNTADTTQPVTLPELIGKAREQAVDLGDQKAPTAGAENSVRQHIQVYNGNSLEPGFFTANKTLDPERDYKLALDGLAVKYPDYLPLINSLN